MLPRLLWTASLLGLCLATWLSWQHRFKDSSGGAHLIMGPESRAAFYTARAPDLIDWAADGQSVRIRASSSGGAPTLECHLQGLPPTGHIWTRIRVSGEQLAEGNEDWQIARAMLVWRDETGGLASRQDPLCGLKRHSDPRTFESVVRLREDLGTPLIAIQNLAEDGNFTIHSLEIIPVEQRWWFPWTATLLVIGWCALTAFAFGRWLVPQSRRWRIALAATAWVALAAFFLFPGPYYPLRPMLTGFELDSVEEAPRGAAKPPPEIVAPQAAGTADQGPNDILLEPDKKKDPVSVLVRWKKHIRTLMHVGAYAAMMLGFFLLLGSRKAWIPVALLGAGSELLQWLWGFGFDWLDVYDLLINGIGIALGLIAIRMGQRWSAGRRRIRENSGC